MMRRVRPTYRHVFVVVAVLVSLYFGIRTSHAVVADRALAIQLQDAQRAVDSIQQQNGNLSAELAYQRTPAYAEQIAREELGFMKPGDHVVHVQVSALAQGLPVAPPPAAAATLPPSVSSPNWKRWLQLFAHPAAFDAETAIHAKA